MKRVMLAIAALSVMALVTAGNAVAGDWNFYGSSRVGTFVKDVDNKGATPDTKDFDQYLHGNSRIGAKIKVSDELSARFELGVGSTVKTRQIWGKWDFGAGTFLVGQTYTPIYMGYSNQVWDEDNGLEKYGAVSASRQPMLQLQFGGLKIAAVEEETDALGTGGTLESTLPKVEVSYNATIKNISFELAGGYNSYELTTGGNTYDVDSYVVAAGAEFKFGAASLGGNLYFGENLGPYGFKVSTDADPAISGTTLNDNEGMGYILVFGYKFNDMLKMEAGYGYQESELDGAVSEDDAVSYYLQATITLAPGVTIVPEIGIADAKNNNAGAEESENTYYGIRWRIDF